MKKKEGMGWEAFYDEERNLYTAATWGMGCFDIFEINSAIFSQVDDDTIGASESARLIHSGRHLYMDVNDRCGPPYSVMLDDDVLNLCPWAEKKINGGGSRWGTELTDAAVEIFDSEKKNREKRRKKREEREKKK
ncbi:MAG: hypothetical protein IKZ82_06555 [Clostridia bacterium]|nr:hypothetical protein [Clostridia bacterium]